MTSIGERRIDVGVFEDGVLAGDRTTLARAITLVESTRADHQDAAQELLVRLTPFSGRAQRVGITGVPGVGKSTFIDALGTTLTEQEQHVAVLAIDPSSSRTGGSILGDKTRMARLAYDRRAFIRPSPTSGTLGGVARATREAIVLVEAAGFDVVLVETVGVGQSETVVAEMVDTFLVLLLARSGDSLQGIKKGVLELADVLAINKADGDHVVDAQHAARELADALHLIRPATEGWAPPVLTCSARDQLGLDDVWAQVTAHHAHLDRTGQLTRRRREQQVGWMWSTVDDRLRSAVRAHPRVQELAARFTEELAAGRTTPTQAALQILRASLEPERRRRVARDRRVERADAVPAAAGRGALPC
jgi:LAO/AO transport system kinase